MDESVVAAGDQLGSPNVQAKNFKLFGVPSEVVDVDTYSPKPPQPKKWLNNEPVQLDSSHKPNWLVDR